HIAEPTWIGPGHGFQADSHHVRIVGETNLVIVREETKLASISLAVVKQDGALPAAFLVVVQLAEMGDDSLSWSSVGTDALDQGVVGARLAVSGAVVASQEHDHLPACTSWREAIVKSRWFF